MPGVKQAWPIIAACWSPATPRSGISAPSTERSVVPNGPEQSRTSGSKAAGMRNRSSSSGSHRPVRRSSKAVRLALVASVACTRPPVSRQSSQLSTVPKARWPELAAWRAPSTWSSNQAILVALKYGSRRRPVRAPTSASCPSARSPAQAAAVRRSCQTTALWMARPVRRSQIRVVSRWLVMPIAATRSATFGWSSSSRSTARLSSIRSSAACSTQPEAG